MRVRKRYVLHYYSCGMLRMLKVTGGRFYVEVRYSESGGRFVIPRVILGS